MPTLNVIAGPNGSGKTTYSEFLRKNSFVSDCEIVNIDGLSEYIDWTKVPDDPFRYQNVYNREIDLIFRSLACVKKLLKKIKILPTNVILEMTKYDTSHFFMKRNIR